jgi:4'-phosphopantetheinyl transferase
MIISVPADVLVVALHEVDAGSTRVDWLTAEERSLLASFHHERRRTSFVMGRNAARLAASAWTGSRPEEIEIGIEASGAVTLVSHPCSLSIAHSGELAMAVISARQVGVDLERSRPVARGLVERISSPEEQERLNESGLPNVPLACWTLKEAVLKAIGTGLRIAPRRLDLYVDGEAARIETPEHGAWDARIRHSGEYTMAVAWQ